jgi:hypothetical protein
MAKRESKGRRKQTAACCGAYKCKWVQVDLDAAGVGTAVDHNIDAKSSMAEYRYSSTTVLRR